MRQYYSPVIYTRKWEGRVWYTQPQFSPNILPPIGLKKIAINMVGEQRVPSGRELRYILTIIDLYTLLVEVPLLKYLTVEDVADALLSIVCRIGFHDVILSDNRPQFVSRTMRSFTDMLSINQTFSSRYHQQSNGMLKTSIIV